MHTPFATLLGYDATLLRQLTSDELKTLDRLVEAWLLSCLLFACPIAYALWLIEHSILLSGLGAFGTFALVFLLLRLSVAGGGAAPHLPRSELETWTPALGPTAVLFLLALLLSQPAQLPLWRTELAGAVDAHRRALVAAQHALGDEPLLQGASTRAAQHEQNEFLAVRLQAMWSTDAPRALRFTFLYALLVMLPAAWARLFGLKALRAYERKRLAQMLKLIRRDERLTEARVRVELSRWVP